MSPTNNTNNWRSIAEKASTEMDGRKLARLIDELCRAIDEEHKDRSHQSGKNPPQPED
jgi:hypothetical protein